MSKFELSAIFSKGQLLQVGDIVSTKEEFLNCIGTGFENITGSGYISKITTEPDTIANSSYLNLGLTYCTNQGLGNKIYLNSSDKHVYAHECKLLKMHNPRTYLNEYFNIECNQQKRDYLLWFLKNKMQLTIENNYYSKRLGYFLFKYAPDIFRYFKVAFDIRGGFYGKVHIDNLADITAKELKNNFGEIYRTDNIIHLITSAKSEFTKGKLFIKGKEEYYIN